MPTIIDSFTGNNNDALSAGWTVLNGTINIQLNRAQASGSNPGSAGHVAVKNFNDADVDITVTVNANGTTNNNGVVVRSNGANANGVYILVSRTTPGRVRVSTFNGSYGSFTNYTAQATDFGANSDVTLRVVVVGNSYTLYADGVEIATFTNSFNQTETYHGMRFGEGPAFIDEYTVTGDNVSTNAAPNADAGADELDIVEGETVVLDSSASSDSDGTITARLWTQTEGTTVPIEDETAAVTSFVAPQVSSDENLVFQIAVTDDDNVTSIDTVIKRVLASASLPPTATFDFNQADGSALPVGFIAQNGAFDINSNRLKGTGSSPGGPEYIATYDSGDADVDLSLVVNANGGTNNHGVVFRYSDNNNLWAAFMSGTSPNNVRLMRRQSGAWSQIASVDIGGAAYDNSADYVIGVDVLGNSITVSINGTDFITHTDAFNNTATQHGVRLGDSIGTADDFVVTNLSGGEPPDLPNNSITILTPENRHWQHINRLRTIELEYEAVGSATSYEMQINDGAWQAAPNPVIGPNSLYFPINLAVGSYKISIRFANDVNAVDTINYVAVSHGFACVGQSNMVGQFANQQTYSRHANGARAGLFSNADTWKELEDHYDDNTGQVDSTSSDSVNTKGSFILRFAHHFIAMTGEPCFFVPCAKNGTSIEDWSANSTRVIGGLNLQSSAKRRITAVGGVKTVLRKQGERNAHDDYYISGAEYEAYLNQEINDWIDNLGASGEVFIIPLHTLETSNYNTDRQDAIRQAQGNVAAAHPNARLSQSIADIAIGGDGVHFSTDAQAEELGLRAATSFLSEENIRPVANAGVDLIVVSGETGQLDGTGSTDANAGDSLTFSWTPPAGFTLDSANTAQPGFTAPAVTQSTPFDITLVVNDGTEDSLEDTVRVTVVPEGTLPIFNRFNLGVSLNNAPTNRPAITSSLGAIYQSRDAQITITVDESATDPTDFSQIDFGLFTVAGNTPLIRKELGNGIAIVDGKIVITLPATELTMVGRHLFEIAVSTTTIAALYVGYTSIVETRLS